MNLNMRRSFGVALIGGALLLGVTAGCDGGGSEAVAPEEFAPLPPDDMAGEKGAGGDATMEQPETDG